MVSSSHLQLLCAFVFSVVSLVASIPFGCKKPLLIERLKEFIQLDEPIAFRIILEQECVRYIDFKADKEIYTVVPAILESELPTDSRKQMLTSFARLGCHLPFHRALYKTNALQSLEIWRMLKHHQCKPNTYYLNSITRKYPRETPERRFLLDWMFSDKRQRFIRWPFRHLSVKSPATRSAKATKVKAGKYNFRNLRRIRARSVSTASISPLPSVEHELAAAAPPPPQPIYSHRSPPPVPLSVIKAQTKPRRLLFGYLRGVAEYADETVFRVSNSKSLSRNMGHAALLNEGYLGLLDGRHAINDIVSKLSKLKSLNIPPASALAQKIRSKNDFGFVRIDKQSQHIEALLYKDAKLIVLSRDQNDDIQIAYPPAKEVYTSLQQPSDDIKFVKVPIKPSDIVLLMRRQSFLPRELPRHADESPDTPAEVAQGVRPHDINGVFYFCDLPHFDHLFTLLTKHIFDRTQSHGLLVVGGYVFDPHQIAIDNF